MEALYTYITFQLHFPPPTYIKNINVDIVLFNGTYVRSLWWKIHLGLIYVYMDSIWILYTLSSGW